MPLGDTAIRGIACGQGPEVFRRQRPFSLRRAQRHQELAREIPFSGPRETLTLGTYPQLSLKEAREASNDAKKLLRRGIDPSAQKKAASRIEENSFEAIAREWHANKKSAWSERYAEDVLERIAVNVFPYLGKYPISEITPPELLAVLRKIEARGASYQANRIRESCSQIFRYAIATGRAERDTAADLRGALKPHITTSRAAITDPVEVGGLLRAIDAYTGNVVTRCGFATPCTDLSASRRSSPWRMGRDRHGGKNVAHPCPSHENAP